MSMLIPMTEATGTPPLIPEAFSSQYNNAVASMQQGFFGSANRIKPGKVNFTLTEGGVKREVNTQALTGVLLAMSPIDHCVWFAKEFIPGQEPEQPDLVWNWVDKNVFPDALPVQYRQKVMKQGKPRWAFQICRRSVWALVQSDPQTGQIYLDLSNPYVFDLTSASMYGKSNAQANTYKWAGLVAFCQRFAQMPNFPCNPTMFPTQIVIDTQSSISGVVMFRPCITPQGAPQYLDNNTFDRVVETMMSAQVQGMLEVREILDYEGGNAAAPTQTYTAPPTGVYEAQPVQPAAPVQPVQPQPVTTPGTAVPPPPQTVSYNTQPQSAAPVMGSESSLLAAAAAALGQPMAPAAPAQPVQTPPMQAATAAPQANVTADTSATLAALDSIL